MRSIDANPTCPIYMGRQCDKELRYMSIIPVQQIEQKLYTKECYIINNPLTFPLNIFGPIL